MTAAQSIGERLRRNRHLPRLCTSCGAPLAAQQDTCWSCAAQWSEESDAPQARLRLVASPPAPTVSTAERLARLREQARA
jgi:predicted amidophosphoribosyltransferase